MNEELPGGTFRVEAGVRTVGSARPVSERPLHIVLVGDFSGRGNRGEVGDRDAVARREPVQVDRDNVDEVMRRFAPSLDLRVASGAQPIRIPFAALDDFHPDQLFEQPELFSDLRAARAAHPETDVTTAPGAPEKQEAPGPAEPSAGGDMPPADAVGLLDQIVDGTAAADRPASTSDAGLREFVRRVVQPHEVAELGAEKAAWIARVDERIAERMRRLLHLPEFQALEGLWRAVSMLCRRVETSESLKLFLHDLSRDELALDQNPSVPVNESGLYRSLVEAGVGTPGAVPWGLIVGCYAFGPGMDDAKLLARLAAIAQVAGAPWISGAEPGVVGCPSFGTAPDPTDWHPDPESAWDALRLIPQAAWLGLVLPRFLVRLPYGSDTDQCEVLSFEEFEDTPRHEDYLWGNSALLCALLVAQSFSARGWNMRLGEILEVGGLPLHVRKSEHGAIAQPCAEALLTERALARIAQRGLMAMASYKDGDVVRLSRFQSVAEPPAPLRGPWE